MASFRSFEPNDLFKLNLTNLDPLTENYNLDFYFHYLCHWPDLFTVAQDAEGHIIAYVMGKVQEDPSWRRYAHHFLPWHGHITALTVASVARRLYLAQVLTQILEKVCDESNAWFMDLFVRAGNKHALSLYEGLGYTIFRKVVDYYSDRASLDKGTEDALDMRKALSRDREGQHIRKRGTIPEIRPEDLHYA